MNAARGGDTMPGLRGASEPMAKAIERSARAIARSTTRRRKLLAELEQLDTSIRDERRTLRSLISTATPAPAPPPADDDEIL